VSKTYLLQREQWVPIPIEEMFSFFSDARNLEAITPPWLNFSVLTKGRIHMSRGAHIRYRLNWHGISLHWETEIAQWDPPHCFEDIQLSGPYRLWRHSHRFESVNGGTRMTDTVRYALPFGILGRIAHAVAVRRNLEQIFNYRCDRIRALGPVV
jgi:ligand-binding SRPBCC domain-containing protein